MGTPVQSSNQAAWSARSEALLRDSVELQAVLLSHTAFADAAAAFARDLAARLRFDRVAIGVAARQRVEIAAISDASRAESPLAARLAAAMAESLDQRASIVWPEPRAGAHPRITLAQRQLLAPSTSGGAATVPLMAGNAPVGLLTVVRHGAAIGAPEVEALEHLACLAGPVFELMRRNERALRERALDALARLVPLGRRRFALRRYAPIAAVLAVSALALWPVDFRIGGHARLEGAVQRVLVAPADGFLRHVHVRPGDAVVAGQTLVEFAEQDLLVERQRWQSQMAQHETAHAAANARADRAQLVISHARAAEAEAQLALVEMKLERARLEAPFDGIVIRGDLSQSLGAPMQEGAELMTIAPRDRFRVIVEVDERDIAAVRVGQGGSLALSALPWDTLPLRVTRISPMASALEGRNAFEVEAALLEQPADLRPGLQGSARIVAGRHNVLWSWSRRLVDAARLAVWEWIG